MVKVQLDYQLEKANPYCIVKDGHLQMCGN